MKKISIIIIIIIVLCIIAVGCSTSKVKNDTEYLEFAYSDETKDFVATGCKLSFNNGFKGFEMTFPQGISVMGSTKESLSGYMLTLDKDVLASMTTDTALDTTTDEYKNLLEIIKTSVTANEQIYFSDGFIFSQSSVAMMKAVDEKNTASLDGLYDYDASAKVRFRLKNGYVYQLTTKTENNKTTEIEEEKPSLRYVLQNRIIKMIRIDENGNDLYIEGELQTTSYFFATITYPKNFANNFDPKDKNYEQAQKLAGKTFSVLTTKYYHS